MTVILRPVNPLAPTTQDQRFLTSPSLEDENLLEVRPAPAGILAAGTPRDVLDDALLVFWEEPLETPEGELYYHAMTWEYFFSEDDGDYILA